MSGHNQDPRGRERIYAEALSDAQERIDRLEAQVAALQAEVSIHGTNIKKLRIDRQIARIPRWLGGKTMRALKRSAPAKALKQSNLVTKRGRPSKRSLAVVVPTYPTGSRSYGGQPVERRVRFYKDAGFDVTVVVVSKLVEPVEDRDGVRIIHTSAENLGTVLRTVNPSQLCVHHPVPEHWAVAKELAGQIPVHVWIHGFEARDWRELDFNYTPQEQAEMSSRLDAITFDRRQAIREVFVDDRVTKIFVSEFMKTVAEDFAGIPADNTLVIHNVIDPKAFPHEAKVEDDRLNILSIRSFDRRNYGTDLIQETISLLANEPFFEELTFTIVGDGKHFDEDTLKLTGYSNVTVSRQILSVEGMKAEFDKNGVILIPSRWDSQGMTMGEAMAAGLVPVTNSVAAIPEFVDNDSAILAEPEDAAGLAAGIARIYRDPDEFVSMSAAAASRVKEQCSPLATVQREIDLLEAAES